MSSGRSSAATVTVGAALLLAVAAGCGGDSGDAKTPTSTVEALTRVVLATPTMGETGNDPPFGNYGGVGQTTRPGPDVMPKPGATPDTTQSWWAVPYKNADRRMPIETLTLNGITIGPNVERVVHPCKGVGADVALEDISQDPVGIDLKATPANAVIAQLHGDGAQTCDGEVFFTIISLWLPPDPSANFLGGSFDILRWVGEPAVLLAIPTQRWSEATVAGQPGAVARPILPDLGLGNSAVVTYQDGILTLIRADGITLEMLMEIAIEVLD